MKKYILTILFVIIATPVSFADSKYAPYYYYSPGVLEMGIGQQCEFYEGQKVWDILLGRGTVKKVDRSRDDSMAIGVEMDDRSLGYGSLGYRWYALNGTYDIKDKTKRLYDAKTKIVTFDFDKLFPEKKPERLLVRELIGSETAGLRLSQRVSGYNCIECGESLVVVPYVSTIYFCFECKKYFNIEKGE